MSLKLYKEQYQMLEKIAAEMHNANVKQAGGSREMAAMGIPQGSPNVSSPPRSTSNPVSAADIAQAQLGMTPGVEPPRQGSRFLDSVESVGDVPLMGGGTAPRSPASMVTPGVQFDMNTVTRGLPSQEERAWHAAITDPIRRAAGWVDDHAQSLGGLTGAEAPWLKRTIGYGAPALAAAGLGVGAHALLNRGGGEDPQQQESLASADLYNTIRQLQAENAEFRAYFQKQASAPPPRTIDDLSLEEKREFFQKHASPDQQNQMFVDEVVKTAAAMLTVNGLENGSNPFDPIAVREAAVDLLRSKGYKV